MKCNKCNQESPTDSLFCQYCGANLEEQEPERKLPSFRELFKDEIFLTMRAWDGTLASVPESMAENFQKRQTEIKLENAEKTIETLNQQLIFSKNEIISHKLNEELLNDKLYKQIEIFEKYKRFSATACAILIITCIITGIICYKTGYEKSLKENQPYSDDGSPTVYITPSGSKYHAKYCDYVNGNAIEISLEQAEAQGYTDCSKCVTPR